ncbi:phage minor head protein [Lactiplantibacillus plantarum]|uniref:phage minor head protein n=1 Tax=Lactiplantibacillus plantarum TaxID=1590 RepID=UPI0025507149|nr:phage minor head protein [Lactiplantibacillus plantarum]
MVNTILKEADLFCPNSVRINFTIYLTTNEAIRNSNGGKNRAYDEQNVQYVMWLTEEDDRVCDICEPLDRQTFAYGQAPIPVTDTHPRCRCQLVACDEDGNLLSGELDRVFKEQKKPT